MSLEDLRSLVTAHRACDAGEIVALRDYHTRESHVAGIVVPLLDQGVVVRKASVRGLARIGQLRTFFGNIGNAHCRTLFGTDRYRVAQALEVLHNPFYNTHQDVADTREKVNRYKFKFALPGSDPKVTIVSSHNDVLIADGNKTAIAAYVYAVEIAEPEFELQVHYIDVPNPINWIL